jgi:pimeloyl-ACP methyl ester carboxylesterase
MWLAAVVLTLSLAQTGAVATLAHASRAGVTVAATPCSRSLATSSTATEDQSASRRPVVFVHGWTGNGNVRTGKPSLQELARVLKSQLNNQIQPYFYDYGPVSTTWASRPEVAGCLGKYVTDVSKAFHDAGGDSKVLIVAHSMGGLATLYAADGRYTTAPIGPLLAGVVTFDTPFLGSPWGGTPLAGLKEQFSAAGVPPPSTDAGRCLGVREPHMALPEGCGGDPPPLLPAGVPLQQIAGSIAVHRSFFGFAAYDLPLASDAVVSVDSANSYLGAAASGVPTQGQKTRLDTDGCVVDYTAIQDLIMSKAFAPTPAGLIAAGLLELAQLKIDSTAMDGAVSGHLTPGAIVYDAAAVKTAPCSHLNVIHDQSAMNMATEALKADLAADPVTLPVTAADLLTAPVPALRGNPAGRLVNGTLPNPFLGGLVKLTQTGGGAPARGDFTGDGVSDSAAVIGATSGAGGWDEVVELYTNGDHLLGGFDPAGATNSYHAQIQAMVVRSGEVLLDWQSLQNAAGQNTLWSAHLRWDGHKVVVTKLVPQTQMLPSFDQTAENAMALEAFLRAGVPGLEPIKGSPGAYDRCQAITVRGADLKGGALDMHFLLTPGGDCGGDAAGTDYKIRNHKVTASSFGCGDCEGMTPTGPDLKAAYGTRRSSVFTIKATGVGTGWQLLSEPPRN